MFLFLYFLNFKSDHNETETAVNINFALGDNNALLINKHNKIRLKHLQIRNLFFDLKSEVSQSMNM